MPAFKKFGAGDQVDNVLILEPSYDLVSGSGGWRGSPDGSASISLYGGARRSPARVVTDITYQSLFPDTAELPKPRLGLPTTASVNVVWMTDETLSLTQRNSNRWGDEHWDTVQRLYQDYVYRDADFVTSSYDYYCLYFQKDSGNILLFHPPATAGLPITASFTVESWVKPFLTASLSQDFTIASMNQVFWFGITGSTGRLQISSSFGTFTASMGPPANRWSHVSFAYDFSTKTGSFTVNMADAGSMTQSTFSGSLGQFLPAFTVGGQLSGSLAFAFGDEYQVIINQDYTRHGLPKRSFHGFIGETRLWCRRRSVAEISSSMSIPLTGSSLADSGLVTCAKLCDGPLTTFPIDQNAFSPRLGSGTVDSAAIAQVAADVHSQRYAWGWMLSFDDRYAPGWHPSDNVSFYPTKRLVHPPEQTLNYVRAKNLHFNQLTGSGVDPVARMLVIDVPQAFYGRQIVPNTLRMTCQAFSSASFGLIRTIVDDGRGGLYLSGSASSSSLANREEYAGVAWNKVGNVFYGEGLIVIRDPSLLDFGSTLPGVSADPANCLQISFRGQSRIPVKTLMCRVDRGSVNASLNDSFWTEDDAGNRTRRHASGNLYVTTVGVYNSQRELVGVARLADPIRIRARDRINIKLRMDF